MKILILITMAFALFLTGCSTTYKVSDFSSLDKFYEDFNKSAKDKNLKITLANDSSFLANDGAEISNDTISIKTTVLKEERINKNNVKDIKYFGSNMSSLSATILLNDGTIATAKNVNVLTDSSINAMILESNYEYFPINKVKEVSYNNYGLGVPLSLISGTVIGSVIGYLAALIFTSRNDYGEKGFYIISGVAGIGLVTGTIIGSQNGYTYTYQFNQ